MNTSRSNHPYQGEERAPRDADTELARFRADVIAGFARTQKSVPPHWLYDAMGAALFEEICELPEYYATRAEIGILAQHAEELGRMLGPGITLIELGSGSSVKTPLLLDRLESPRAYIPVDMALDSLRAAARSLLRTHPRLVVLPVQADFTRNFALPKAALEGGRLAIFFPGSTIGNLDPREAVALMTRVRGRIAAGGLFVVGVDNKKDIGVLERAYNDVQGITAAFNRNLLVRMRRELDCDIDPERFEHLALYNPFRGRIEMHLRSLCEHTVRIGSRAFHFGRNETLHTENSYKYTPAEFVQLAQQAGLVPQRLWRDDAGLFSVHVFGAASLRARLRRLGRAAGRQLDVIFPERSIRTGARPGPGA